MPFVADVSTAPNAMAGASAAKNRKKMEACTRIEHEEGGLLVSQSMFFVLCFRAFVCGGSIANDHAPPWMFSGFFFFLRFFEREEFKKKKLLTRTDIRRLLLSFAPQTKKNPAGAYLFF
jgi:hypothetical protein